MMRRTPRPAFADDLDATLVEAFRLLTAAVADRRAPLHTPTLATIARDGGPALRTLVLRDVFPEARTLRLHTNRRAEKAAEIENWGRAALHGYDAAAQIQLRLLGQASLQPDGAIAAAAWATASPSARLTYALALPPGTPIDTPYLPPFTGEPRDNFAIISFHIESLEWLWLAAEGHRRARFTWSPDGQRHATWLVP